MGYPRVRLTLRSPVPVAFVSAKLCDVFPDGTSALVTRGILNLAHRDGHENPKPLEKGVSTTVDIELEATSWIFEAGHRVRLSLAGADWPNVWPPPRGGRIEVDRSSVELALPVLAGDPPAPPPELPAAPPKDASEPAEEEEAPPPAIWRVEHDRVGRQTRAVTSYGSAYDAPFGARVTEQYDGVVGVSKSNPGRAWARATTRYRIEWPEASVATEAHLALRSDANAYHVVIEVVAAEDGEDGIGHVERRFERTIPRRLQ
jgi:hypothetical protein